MSGSVNRPLGVTILAILAFIGGALQLATGAAAIVGGGLVGGLLGGAEGAAVGGLVAISGLFLVVLGIVALLAGYGLWQLASWAWLLTIAWAILGLISAALTLLGGDFASAIISAILPAVVLWYLNRPDIKQAFGRA